METDRIREYYNSQANRTRYGEAVTKSGLWKSEEIIFSKYVDKQDQILDLGCGAGRTTINLYRRGYKNITGLDISDGLLGIAKEYADISGFDIEFILGDAVDLSFDNEVFDVVFFSYNGLMCIPNSKNRLNALKEVYRVLRPKGKFIFTAHDRDDAEEFADFWEEEKQIWKENKQDQRLIEYGDVLTVDITGETTFLHMANTGEIEEMICAANFRVLESAKRSDIAEESQEVQNFSGDTVFWVLKKLSE